MWEVQHIMQEHLIIEVLNILRKHFLLKTQIRDLRRSNHGPVL